MLLETPKTDRDGRPEDCSVGCDECCKLTRRSELNVLGCYGDAVLGDQRVRPVVALAQTAKVKLIASRLVRQLLHGRPTVTSLQGCVQHLRGQDVRYRGLTSRSRTVLEDPILDTFTDSPTSFYHYVILMIGYYSDFFFVGFLRRQGQGSSRPRRRPRVFQLRIQSQCRRFLSSKIDLEIEAMQSSRTPSLLQVGEKNYRISHITITTQLTNSMFASSQPDKCSYIVSK